VLQSVAVRCGVLQCVAECIRLSKFEVVLLWCKIFNVLQYFEACVAVCVAACCSVQVSFDMNMCINEVALL